MSPSEVFLLYQLRLEMAVGFCSAVNDFDSMPSRLQLSPFCMGGIRLSSSVCATPKLPHVFMFMPGKCVKGTPY
jgi:hypothetical protein